MSEEWQYANGRNSGCGSGESRGKALPLRNKEGTVFNAGNCPAHVLPRPSD